MGLETACGLQLQTHLDVMATLGHTSCAACASTLILVSACVSGKIARRIGMPKGLLRRLLVRAPRRWPYLAHGSVPRTQRRAAPLRLDTRRRMG